MAEPDHDPSRDSNAVELADRDPASAAAPPGSHSGGSNTEISHHEDVTETTETTAKVTTTNADVAIEEGGVNAEKGMSLRGWLALSALASMWVAAQAPLFLFAAVPVYIYKDLGGEDHWAWLASANLIATAAVSPFVGTLSDHFGRRPIALLGSLFIMAGQIMCGRAPNMDVFIGGMAVSGVGTGLCELTTLAGIADIVPISKRGYYTAIVILSVVLLVPSVMYGQLIASWSTWRHIAWITGGLPVLALIMTFLFYKPPHPNPVSTPQKPWAFLGQVDFVGGFLSIAGLVLFDYTLLSGGYIRPWSDPSLEVTLTFGFVCMVVFAGWKWRVYERDPTGRWNILDAPRAIWPTLVITFVSGANFFSVLMLWPSEAYNVYGHDPIGVGLRGLPFAVGTFLGCVFSLVLLSRFKRHFRWILFTSSILMTAGCGGLARARVDNLGTVIFLLFLAGLGVGGIVVPASTVATILCDKTTFATVTAFTIAIRIAGGAVGYAIYFNTFVRQLVPLLKATLGEACVKAGITDPKIIEEVIRLTGASLVGEIRNLPGIDEAKWETLVAVGQRAYADAYPYVFYISIIFGVLSIGASYAVGDISSHITDEIPREYP